VGTDRLR